MPPLQDILEAALQSAPRLAVEKRIKAKADKLGIAISVDNLRKAAELILSGASNRFEFDGAAKRAIEITTQDMAEIASELDEFLDKKMPNVVETSAEETAKIVFKSLVERWPGEFAQHTAEMREFKRRLEQRWGKALTKLRMMLTIAREWGQEAHTRKSRLKGGKVSHLDDVLLRLHVRACQVTTEILTLLETGLADGAMARWRTLHEIAVVASLIAKYGNDLAVRYVDYQFVEAKRALNAYENCHKDLGYRPHPKRQAQRIRANYKKIIKKYGEPFGEEYGWAAHHLGKKRVTFAMLEENSGDAAMRAHYRMASYNVHANPKGVYFKLGQLEGSTALLAGASNAGLFEPAQNTGVTLGKLSMLICGRDSGWTFDDLIFGKAIARLMQELPSELKKADDKLARDDRKYRKSATSGR